MSEYLIEKPLIIYSEQETSVINGDEIQSTGDSDALTNEIELTTHNSILTNLLLCMEPIDFREAANLKPDSKIPISHSLIIVINKVIEISKNKDLDLRIHNSAPYVFNGCYWVRLSHEDFESFLGEAAEFLGVEKFLAQLHTFRKKLVKQFISTARPFKTFIQEQTVLINLKNGTFVFTPKKRFLKSFDKDDFLTYQLPFEYDEKAKAPMFESFLNEVIPDKERQDILSEYTGYLFIKNSVLKLEKALFLYGSGGNGKGVFFEVIMALLGKENTTNYSLESLTDEKGYQRADLSGKLVNYASEISQKANFQTFKQMVSGEPVSARVIYGQPFIMYDYAKLIFNTNKLFEKVEQSKAFFRRLILMHFSVTIPDDEVDVDLSQKIIKKELPGVLNWTLEGVSRLFSNKKFTPSKLVEIALEQFKNESDPVKLFLDDTRYEKDCSNSTYLSIIYKEYVDYCKSNGYKADNNRDFSKQLETIGYKKSRDSRGTLYYAKKNTYCSTID